MTLLIDADWLIYSACAACETDIRWDEWINTLHLEQADVKDYVSSRLSYWRDISGHKEVVMCLSDYPTFRHEIHSEYKANRIGKRKPLGLRDIRLWIEQSYATRTCIGLEADDVMGVLATGGYYPDPIIVSIDKDMRTLPCQLLAGDDVETIHPAQANRIWMMQSLTGDSTDNYPGIKGVGPAKAAKLLGEAGTLPDMWEKVVAAYRKEGMTFKDALLNARLARILRHGDYDFASGDIKLWDPDVDPSMKAA
jgi:DNA polymerase-1